MPPQVLAEVADDTTSVVNMGVQVGWMDILAKIGSKKMHLDIIKKLEELTKELEQLNRRRDEIIQTLAEIDVGFVYNDFSFHQVFN